MSCPCRAQMRDVRSILSVIDNAPFGQTDWVVSRYIERPLLLRGSRKFDIRTWVLVDHNFHVYMYR
jgi:tubulin--tyrosine ligase